MNKKAKRIITMFLVVCMMIMNIIPAMVYAEGGNQTIIVSESVCNTNDKTVDVTISLKDNPGIVSMLLTVGFDNTALKLTKVTDGGKIGTQVHSDNYNNPYTLCWVNDTATTNFTDNGVIVTLTFEIAENAAAGNYPVTVSYVEGNYDIYDKDVNLVDFALQNGSVTIKEVPVSVTGVTVNPEAKTLTAKGETFTLTANVAPANATNKNVTFTSNNPSVATVDASTGVVTAVANGTATITVTTEDGSKTDSCAVTVDIPHVHEYDTTEWKSDGTNHWHECTSGDGATIDVAEHTGGTATCTAKAVCAVCDTPYGESAPHTYVEKEEAEYIKSEANCVSKAVYYVSCEGCGAAGTDTFEAGEIDSDNHTGETYLENKEDATCTEDGYSGDVYCEDCGVKLEDGKVVPAGHKLEKVEAKEPTHEEDGNTEYYYCSGCEKAFVDSEAEEEIDLEDTVIAKGEHSYSEDYDSDEENHWKGCDCGSVIEKEAHTFSDWTVTKDATETEKGSKERVCSVCEYKAAEEIPAIGAEDESTSESESESQNNTASDTPQTGDVSSTVLWIMLVLIAGFGTVGATVLKRKYTR